MLRSNRSIAPLLALLAGACAELPSGPSTLPVEAAMARVNAHNGMQPLDVWFIDDWTCSFPFETTIDGYIKVASVQGRRDGTTRVVEIVPNARVTTTANGVSLTSPIAGTAFYEFDAANQLDHIVWVGMNAAVKAGPGRPVLLETGRLVVGADGTIRFESGPHQLFGANPDTAAFCAAMA